MKFETLFPLDLGCGLRARITELGGRPAFLEISADGKARCVHAFQHPAVWDWDHSVAIERGDPLTIDGMLLSPRGPGRIVAGRWVDANAPAAPAAT